MSASNAALIIVPGVASPSHPRYRVVRDTLADAASERGYATVQTISYPGQDTDGTATLDLETSATALADAVRQHRARGQIPSVLARSYGCYVALRALGLNDPDLQVARLVLWGPPPYWLMYEFWKRDLDVVVPEIGTTRRLDAAQRGTRVDTRFFDSLIPLELLLRDEQVEHRIEQLILATGQLDPYCPPEFLTYVSSLVPHFMTKLTLCDPIMEVGHAVIPSECSAASLADYLDAVLGTQGERND